MLVATVQRTGTRWLLDKFAPHGSGRCVVPLEERARAKPTDVLHAHLSNRDMPGVLAFEGEIFTTQRSEAAIRASWCRIGWGHRLHELDEQLANHRTLLERRPYVVEISER